VIFVDASALVSVILRERGSASIVDVFDAPPARLITSPIAVYEAAFAVARVREFSVRKAEQEVLYLCTRVGIVLVSIDAEHAEMAISAFQQFGKGRHPAKLNMGDCFAYAVARSRAARILFVGSDFTHTDLVSALPAQ
jgi:ribonuclease VapC